MDAERFDTLTRSLGAARSRRGFARLLGGLTFGAVAGALTGRDAAAETLIGGSSCSRDGQCKTGKCLKSGRCACSRAFPKCKQPRNPCQKATCDVGSKRCLTENASGGCPDDDNPCTKNVCKDGACTHPPDAGRNGTSCGSGRRVCVDGACCEPSCGGKSCGDDTCGGSCGSCVAGEHCQGGTCACDVAGAPGPGEICEAANDCCPYPDVERFCNRGAGSCQSFLPVCRYGLGGKCAENCDCQGDLECHNSACRCPDGRLYLADGLCCAQGLAPCGNRCCPPGSCFCFPGSECRCDAF